MGSPTPFRAMNSIPFFRDDLPKWNPHHDQMSLSEPPP